MKELVWQLEKNKGSLLILMITFGGILILFLMLVGDDNVVEAVYRMLFLFLGMCALFLYGERSGILKRKAAGSAFYHSMSEGLKKEKKRWLVLDVSFLVTSTVLFLLYKVISAMVAECFDGGVLYLGFLMYLVCLHLFVKHPYVLACVTMIALLMLGMVSLFSVPFVGIVIGIGVCVTGMAWHYHRIERMWNEEE